MMMVMELIVINDCLSPSDHENYGNNDLLGKTVVDSVLNVAAPTRQVPEIMDMIRID